jgi:hypothetical protein
MEFPMTVKNKTEEIAVDTKLAAGVQAYFAPSNVTVTVAGVVMTPAQVEAAIQSRVTAINASKTAKAALAKAVADAEALMTSTQPVVDAVKQIALIMYVNQPAVLTVFGITPKKVPVALTAVELAERAAKAAATRLARNTMGPKEKAKVKGVLPATAPAATAIPATGALASSSTPISIPAVPTGTTGTGHS